MIGFGAIGLEVTRHLDGYVNAQICQIMVRPGRENEVRELLNTDIQVISSVKAVNPMPDLEDTVQGDVSDFDTLLKATEGMDAVIHLPGNDSQWGEVLQNALTGTYNMLEASKQNGVRRIAYASRAGVLPRSYYTRSIQRTVDMPTRPDSYYSVSKVFGESLGYMYATRFDMEVVAVRIGNFQLERDLPGHPHHLSHGDAVLVFERAVIQPGIRFEVVFGVSDSTWKLYDLDHGRKVIGYNPQDKSIVEPEL